MVKLYDFTTALFTQPGKWSTFNKADKNKHFFMTSRYMAINYPLQAQPLNHIRINTSATMDFWQGFIRARHQSVPHWMWIKGSVKAQKTKEKKAKVSEKSIINFAKANNFEIKSVKESLNFFPEETVKEIKKWEKVTS